MDKYLSLVEKIVKIGPVDPEIIGLVAIIKRKKAKKVMQAKHIVLPASLPSGLNNSQCLKVLVEISQP